MDLSIVMLVYQRVSLVPNTIAGESASGISLTEMIVRQNYTFEVSLFDGHKGEINEISLDKFDRDSSFEINS